MGHTLPTLALALGLLIATPLTAAAQVADPECPPPSGSTAETLMADLANVLPASCSSIDFKAVGKRIKDTEHIGTFTKLRFALRAQGVLEDAKAYDRAKTPAEREKLRVAFDRLIRDFTAALDGKDPELVRVLGCAREFGFEIFLKGVALENAKERGSDSSPG